MDQDHKELYVVLDKGHTKTFCIFFKGARWLQFWALLQHSDESKKGILDACKLLETSSKVQHKFSPDRPQDGAAMPPMHFLVDYFVAVKS